MPKLPDKFALGGIPGTARRAPATISSWPTDTGGEMIAGEIAKGGAKLAATLQAKVEEADEYDVAKKLVEFDLEQEKRLDDAKRETPPEAKGFTRSYRTGYDVAATDFMAGIPDRLKPKVDAALVRRGAAFEKRAYDFELAERDRWNVQDVNTKTSDLVTRTMGTPDAMEDNAQRGVAIIRASRLSQRAKVDAERKFLDMNAEFGVKALIDREIENGRDAGDIVERLRKVPRGAAGPVSSGGPGSWRVFDTHAPTAAERREIAKSGGVVVNLDSNWAASDKPTSPMVVIPDNATEDQRRAAEAYASGVAKIYNEQFGTDLKPRVVTRSQNGRGRAHTIHTEPFSVNDTRAVDYFTSDEGRSTHARLLKETFGGIPGVAFAVPHDPTRKGDKGAVGPRGSEVDLARRLLADLKGGGEPDLVEGPREVTRRDLAPVRLAEAGTGTMTDASPDKKWDDALPAEGSGSPTLDKDGLAEAEDAEWSYMSPVTRRKLITYARNAGRAVITKTVEADISRIRDGRTPEVGPDGRTSLDRAKANLTPLQFREVEKKWSEAEIENREFNAMRDLPNDQVFERWEGMVSRIEEEARAKDPNSVDVMTQAASNAQKRLKTQVERLVKLRTTDPVTAVTGSRGDGVNPRTPPHPAILDAMQQIKESQSAWAGQQGASTRPDAGARTTGATLEGQPVQARVGTVMSPKAQWKLLFDARLDAQKSYDPDERTARVLSKSEAVRLLGLPSSKGTVPDDKRPEKAYRERLEAAAKRAREIFPPEYADRAFRDAIALTINTSNAEKASLHANLIAKLARGEAVSRDDVKRIRDMDAIDDISLASRLDLMGRMDSIGRGRSAIPTGNAGAPAIVQGVPQPNPAQVQWLRANPDGWQVFDRRFGSGAASRALGGTAGDPWGSKRGAVPQRDWRSDETTMKPATGWFGFGR